MAVIQHGTIHYTFRVLCKMLQILVMGCDDSEGSFLHETFQYSFSDDASKLGAPSDFDITVRNLKVSAGAGFIVALTGDIMTMPGLPKHPAAEKIDIDINGKITGLF